MESITTRVGTAVTVTDTVSIMRRVITAHAASTSHPDTVITALGTAVTMERLTTGARVYAVPYGYYGAPYYRGYGYRYPYYGRHYYHHLHGCDGGAAGAIIGGTAGAIIGYGIDRSYGYHRYYGHSDGTTGAIVGAAAGGLIGYGIGRHC